MKQSKKYWMAAGDKYEYSELAFIGLSNNSPWGLSLAAGRRWIIGTGGDLLQYWWVFFPITVAIILFGIGWNLIGDNVNDWLNPHRDQ